VLAKSLILLFSPEPILRGAIVTEFASDVSSFAICDSERLPGIHPRLAEMFLLLDSETRQHSIRVHLCALKIGTLLDLRNRELEQLAIASLFHDLGKIAISQQILEKRGRLTPLEFRKVQMHPKIGASLWRMCRRERPVSEAILAHHERFAGGGYPFSLSGASIPLWSRIITIADALDAMTTRRPYREPMRYDQALRCLDMASGTQFDPLLVRLFLKQCPKPIAPARPTLHKHAAPALPPALWHDRKDGDPKLN